MKNEDKLELTGAEGKRRERIVLESRTHIPINLSIFQSRTHIPINLSINLSRNETSGTHAGRRAGNRHCYWRHGRNFSLTESAHSTLTLLPSSHSLLHSRVGFLSFVCVPLPSVSVAPSPCLLPGL